MNDISPSAIRVLQFISKQVENVGYPPTIREICDHFGWSSTNAAHEHVSALAEHGFIERPTRSARAIKVIRCAGVAL